MRALVVIVQLCNKTTVHTYRFRVIRRKFGNKSILMTIQHQQNIIKHHILRMDDILSCVKMRENKNRYYTVLWRKYVCFHVCRSLLSNLFTCIHLYKMQEIVYMPWKWCRWYLLHFINFTFVFWNVLRIIFSLQSKYFVANGTLK